MALPRAYQGKISADGTRIAYRMNNSWDEERRNYRGGQNRPIWIVDLKTYDLVSPPWTDSKDVDPVWVGDSSTSSPIATAWRTSGSTNENKKLAQITKFTDFDVKSMDSGAGGRVRAGRLRSRARSEERQDEDRQHHRGRRLSVDDAAGKTSRARMTNMALSPTGKRVVVEARGEIFTIPAEKGDVRNLTNSSGSAERDPAWSPDGKFVSYFSDKSGEYKLVIEAQDGLTPPREIALAKPTHYYTPSWSPDSKKLLFTDTNLKVWVLDVASGRRRSSATIRGWCRSARSIRFGVLIRSGSLTRAVCVRCITRSSSATSRPARRSRSPTVSPTRLAGVGRERKVSVVPRVDRFRPALAVARHDVVRSRENFGLYFAVLKKGDASPLLPESDEDRGVGTARADLNPARRGWQRGAAALPKAAAGGQAKAAPRPTRPRAWSSHSADRF
jgi:tricorn protease